MVGYALLMKFLLTILYCALYAIDMGRKEFYKYLGIDVAGSFSGSQICEILKIPRSTFYTWNKDFFKPSGAKAPGPYRAAEWTVGDIISIKAFQTLIN